MRIVHIMRSVDPAGGGPIEGVKQLAAVNTRRGHEVEVASLDPPNARFLAGFPIPVYPLGPGMLKYGYSRSLVPWIRANLHKYDAVIVNGIWQYQSFGAWRALHGTGKPYVVFTHGMLDPWFNQAYPLKHLKKMLYWPWGERRALRDAAAVLFTSEEERVLARQSFSPYSCNEVVVNYGTSGPLGDPREELDTFYQQHPELRARRIAMFLGRIHPKKGCDLLIRAFAQVLARDPSWVLLMCGPDQVGWRAALEKLAVELNIADRVLWLDMVQGAEKWGALRAAEIFALPSHQENFGIVVAEALACGTPVLISNKVNIWREVQECGAGFVASDDLEGTCTMLSNWLALTPDEQNHMRHRTRACFLEKFEIHRAADTLIHLLQDVAHDRHLQTT